MSPPGRGVLIGFADALSAPEVADSLLDAGVPVVAFARAGKHSPLRYLKGVELVEVTAPEIDFDASVNEIAAIAARCEATMPLDDPALLVADRAVPAEATLVGPRGSQLEFALDKRLQMRAAEAAGFAVPAWSELDATGCAPDEMGFPLMLKPALAAEVRDGRLARPSPRPVADAAELADLRRSLGAQTPAIVQEWLEGTGRGLFGLAGEESIHHLSAHRRVRMMNPAGSGSSACAATDVPASIVPSAREMLLSAGWRGMFMIELLESAGRLWFMELNGRPWGSIALSRRLGFEYPAWALACARDPAVALPPAPPPRDLVCRNLGREFVHLLFVMRGPRTAVGAWPPRGRTVREMLTNPRTSAWYNHGASMRRLFWHDAWRTVVEQTWGRTRS